MTYKHLKHLTSANRISELPGRAADRADYYMRKFGCDEAQAIEWAIAWFHNLLTQTQRRAQHNTGFAYNYDPTDY